jgi:hypothetical protein
MILSSGTSSVLLNGVPGKKFYCKRGVRQGDPLSPLLFVLAADFLQSLLNKAMIQSTISPPLHCPAFPDFPVIQYADDTLVILKADAMQLLRVKAILNSYAQSTGLKVNYSKSSMMPINLSDERLEHFANTMQCKKGSLPFTYLGLPLCISAPNLEHFLPIVSRVERRLGGIANFLDYGGKLLMVKSVLTFLPIFFMSCLDIPVSIKNQCIKFMRHCLWRKKRNEVQSNGPALVAWDKVCRPKDQGAWGCLILKLKMKHFFSKIFINSSIGWTYLGST